MTKIVVDQAALSIFRNLDDFAELCDSSGRTLGYFTPAADRRLYDEAEMPTISEDELRRREGEKSFTTAEVLKHLEQLSRPEIS